jgi:NAD-dependent SIR2 family protein deacetylase
VPLENLPPCPKCRKNILRPGVVWFGESLPEDVLGAADAYINDLESIDIVMVIGTSARVWPAAGYIDEVMLSQRMILICFMCSRHDRQGTEAPECALSTWVCLSEFSIEHFLIYV